MGLLSCYVMESESCTLNFAKWFWACQYEYEELGKGQKSLGEGQESLGKSQEMLGQGRPG
ncbi:MAG TPA: hypothetical protein DCZ91_19485 [Lachnospiraceae bacterium]|nr:hypothetical protein [Lachnospiraceae bacterium]